jgi:hypothetical protein
MKDLFDYINNEGFLKSKGSGNEVPYYIYDYNPKEELLMRDKVEWIIKKSTNSIVNINLFEVMLELFKDDGVEPLFEYEEDEGLKALLKELIVPVIEEGQLIEFISKKIQGYDVAFITGVGSAFQFIRLHQVLQKLADKEIHMPIIGFYPGTYTMETLHLFNIYESKNYYRAFKLNNVVDR